MSDNEYLLNNMESLKIKDDAWNPTGRGFKPQNRPLNKYIDYGVVVIDKPANPSSHEVVTWVKDILKAEKTGHSGTLDPNVTGVLTICINRATRLAKIQQSLGKTYICEIKFEREVDEKKFREAAKKLTGHLLQRPPLLCAVKRELRLRWIYEINIIEFKGDRALFEVKCEAGSYIRTLCTHFGLFVGVPAEMAELRRTKSGATDESACCTMHDLLDAQYLMNKNKEEKYLRKLIKPLESLLVGYKRIVLKDSAVGSICAGAKLSVQGVSAYDDGIVTGESVVLMTAKGEAVALAESKVTSEEIEKMVVGYVASPKRVIMETDLYPKTWGIAVDYEIYSEEGQTRLE